MGTARERVQSLDAQLRELEERFGGGLQSSLVLPPLPDLASVGVAQLHVDPETSRLDAPSAQTPPFASAVDFGGPLARLAAGSDGGSRPTGGLGSLPGTAVTNSYNVASPPFADPAHRAVQPPAAVPSIPKPPTAEPASGGRGATTAPMQPAPRASEPSGHATQQVAGPAPHGTAGVPARPPLPPAARPAAFAGVPLRLYRQGLPHRDLGPPQSVWEADKNAAVVALSDRVHQLENQLQQQQQQQQLQEDQSALHDPDHAGGDVGAAQAVMPPPPVDLLPVPRTVLGTTSHANVAAYGGIHAGGAPPAPVKYYPPPPGGQPLTAEAALVRVQAAQGPRGQARALAASVTASAAATVPSVMMRRMRNENTQPRSDNEGDGGGRDQAAARRGGAAGGLSAATGGGGGGGITSSVGVSGPLGHASAAASAAASVHMAALREAGPLQPAGPYPMVAAALAVGTPGTGGSTWEQAKMRALMSLEQERDALRAQLEEFRGQEQRHKRDLFELREQHKQDLQNAAGLTGRRLDRLMRSAWLAFSRRLLVLRTSRALHAWRRIAARNRRLQWAAAVWLQRHLGAVFGEWHLLVLTNRRERQSRRRAMARYQRTVLLAWAAAAQGCQRQHRLEWRATQARCRWLLAAWARRADEIREKRRRLQGAAAHRQAVLLRGAWRGLAAAVVWSREAETTLRQRLDKSATVVAFQTWVARMRLARRLDAMHRRGVLRTALRSWAALAARLCALRRKILALHSAWRRRMQAILLAGWAAAAHRLALLDAAGLALETAVSRDLMAQALTALRLAPRERAWGRRRGVVALRAWLDLVRRAVRNRRLVLARRLARNRATLAVVFEAWRVLGKTRTVKLHLREIHRLQELEPMYEHQMELVRQDRAAIQGHVRAVMNELNLLRAELLRGFVMSSEGGLLGTPLRWHSLPPDPDQWQPPPRCRHSTFCLRALQLPHAPPPGAATQPLPMHSTMRATLRATATGMSGGTLAGPGTAYLVTAPLQLSGPVTIHGHHAEVEAVIPDVAGVLVVFGGVDEEEWFRDVHVLEISYTEGGSASFRWHQVEVELEPEPEGGAEATTLRPETGTTAGGGGGELASGKLPLPTRRDHAACVTSPNQFVVVGGFDGSTELMDINAVTVRAAEDSVGWAATVRAVVPRNRTPPGRSHHTLTYHETGRSLYVFGGYASERGALNELWAFHLDHLEWWQPNTTGDQPPPRRNHVAALVGGRLYVHGGFNGMECLGDTWTLDPQTWHWERLRTSGPEPSPRRGHAADVVDDRYLVVHGGYNGSNELADGAVLDTATGAWRDLAAAGGPQDMPTARAYHTLTLVGHVMVTLGGSGPMGPLLDLHLLESPPLVAGLAQQYRLMATAAQLSATQAGMADMEAALAVTRHRAESSEQQLQTLRESASELVSRHNDALVDIDRLKGRVAAEAVRVVAAEAATVEAQLALATAERRLRRTRQGGQEVAAAAQDMHDTVCDLREEVARLRSQLLTTMQQQTRDASQAAATAAERQLLQQQLAGAQQEAALLRGMLATSEAEFRAALDRQRSAAEAELAAAAEHAKQLAVAAAAVAGGAAAAGTAADMDLVALHQLATATARAETAELRLHAMEREYGGLQADVANIKRQLQQQRQAREAAEERAAAAMQHMHASELRYQMQLEDLQRQLAEAQRERWRQDLQLLPPRKRAAPQPEERQASPPPPPAVEPVGSPQGGTRQEDAERLLWEARPPPELSAGEEPARKSFVMARASAVLDPTDPSAHFTVQHVEKVVVEDPALEVLPEVARLLQLQRRLLGQE